MLINLHLGQKLATKHRKWFIERTLLTAYGGWVPVGGLRDQSRVPAEVPRVSSARHDGAPAVVGLLHGPGDVDAVVPGGRRGRGHLVLVRAAERVLKCNG